MAESAASRLFAPSVPSIAETCINCGHGRDHHNVLGCTATKYVEVAGGGNATPCLCPVFESAVKS